MALTNANITHPDEDDIRETRPRQVPVRIGLWGWLGLYVTGAVLLFLVLFHIGLTHYSSSQPLGWTRTTAALRSPLVRIAELGILAFALFHGLMGLRRIILDLEIFKRKGSRYLTWCLTAIGVILFLWGLQIFRHLVSGV